MSSLLYCFFFSFRAAASVLFGVVAGTVCNFATQLKFTLGYDDTLDIFASHAIGGVAGNVSGEHWKHLLGSDG